MLASPRAQQHQVRDVGAGDEQHQADRRGEHEQRLPNVTDDRVVQGDDLARRALDSQHRLVALLVGDEGAQLGDRLPECRVRGQPPDHGLPADAPVRGLDRHRHPELGVLGKVEAVGHHADDGLGVALDGDRPADHRRIAAESVAPDARADDDEAVRALLIFTSRERPPDVWPDAQRVEETRRHASGGQQCRLPGAEERRGIDCVAGGGLGRLGHPPIEQILLVRHRSSGKHVYAIGHMRDDEQGVGVAKGQRP